ncbi:hypothetical protein LRQ11_12060, partial [Pseudomonas sp. MAFF 311095]|nr:hypothetical protein [Pseudomonas petroselini]MCD7071797.1 hypothetical protein [Pseudomonas petroselini]MCD7079548.1 hypothetical protein [Pseudomonas petroselini]
MAVVDAIWKEKGTDLFNFQKINLSPFSSTQRGVDIESHLAKTEYSPQSGWYNVGAERNGYFPLVDFQNGNTLVSLKSVDTAGSTWLGRMQDHIIDLGANGAKVNGVPANMVNRPGFR